MSTSTFLNSTLAYCTDCGKNELARIVERDASVFMERVCSQNGVSAVKISDDYEWYRDRLCVPDPMSKPEKVREVSQGCPQDCGLCAFHATGIQLPVFSITNACNLDCPICFTFNRPDKKYYKSLPDMQRIVEHIIDQAGSVDLVNITGGEPTLHPELFDILSACQRDQIGRVTLNTNGLRLARSKAFARRIKEAGVQIILSLDTFDREKSKIIHGADITEQKRQALARLEKLDIPTTILSVCIKNLNEEDVADIVYTYLKKPFVRSITIQNMTFTGANGSQFINGPLNQPRDHITIDAIEKLLAGRGPIEQSDFFPLGVYHPLCYSVAYYFVYRERLLSLTRLIDRQRLTEATRDSYLLNADSELSTHFLDGINRLWAEGEDPSFVRILRRFIDEMYPRHRHLSSWERMRIGEKMIKPVYIHPHMDADNFDIDRVSRCGDVVPDESGKMIPACSYNLIHRQKDPRFWIEQPDRVI